MPRLRPRFSLVVPCHPALALARFRLRLREDGCPYTGVVTQNHMVLKIREADRHYWSPQLSVDADPHADGTLLRGHFGPSPNVWTLFLALYAGVVFTLVFAAMYATSQWLIAQPPTALWAFPAGALLLAGIYSVAWCGQHLAQTQMQQLGDFFDCAICQHVVEPQPQESAACQRCAHQREAVSA